MGRVSLWNFCFSWCRSLGPLLPSQKGRQSGPRSIQNFVGVRFSCQHYRRKSFYRCTKILSCLAVSIIQDTCKSKIDARPLKWSSNMRRRLVLKYWAIPLNSIRQIKLVLSYSVQSRWWETRISYFLWRNLINTFVGWCSVQLGCYYEQCVCRWLHPGIFAPLYPLHNPRRIRNLLRCRFLKDQFIWSIWCRSM